MCASECDAENGRGRREIDVGAWSMPRQERRAEAGILRALPNKDDRTSGRDNMEKN